MRRTTNVSLQTLHVLHDKFDTQRATQNGATDRPSFWSGMKAHRAGSVAFARAGLYGSGDIFCIPPGAPLPHSAPAAPHTAKFTAVHGEVEVLDHRRQRLRLCTARRKSGSPESRKPLPAGSFP